jgi:hypothetical protein
MTRDRGSEISPVAITSSTAGFGVRARRFGGVGAVTTSISGESSSGEEEPAIVSHI